MLNLFLWLSMLAGTVALIAFAWRSAMRRRGFRLLRALEPEQVLRYAVDVPVVLEGPQRRPPWLARRGTIVLTRKRVAGFTHRARFVLVGSRKARPGGVEADGEWLVVRPGGARRGGTTPAFRFRVPDAEAWSRDARRVLRS